MGVLFDVIVCVNVHEYIPVYVFVCTCVRAFARARVCLYECM